MGNVVSSVLMYALQVAWFCQRLIDQDYRQNHGSRLKPIMDTEETDLDVFLSKCRSYYYLPDGEDQHRRRFGRNEKHRRAEHHHKRKRNHHRNGPQTAMCMQHPQHHSEATDRTLLECDCNTSLFDEGISVHRGRDHKYPSRAILTCPLTNHCKTDADIFRSRRKLQFEFSKSCDLNDLGHEGRDLDLPEAESWKRERFFFGKSLRGSIDTSDSECEMSSVANSDSFRTPAGDRSPIADEDFARINRSDQRDLSRTDDSEAASNVAVVIASDLKSPTDSVESCHKSAEISNKSLR